MALKRFEVHNRQAYHDGATFGDVGPFEQLDGTAHFAVDPAAPGNTSIVDLELAPRNAAGLVEFEADLSVVQPTSPTAGNGAVLVELPNRGRRRVVPVMNCAPPDAPVSRQAHPGDGFLFRHGFTVASIGWQWDVFRTDAMMGLEAPLAMRDGRPVEGQTLVEFRPNENEFTRLLADRIHRPLPAAPGAKADAVLYVRDYEDGEDRIVPEGKWRFANGDADGCPDSLEHIYLPDGFDPGCIYQLVYTTATAPVAGVGLLALRDVAAFLRDPANGPELSCGYSTVLAYGVSQTGRMLRHFLHLGLNRTEDGKTAYDGMHIHVAGARRGAFNHRFAQPSNQTTPVWGHAYPYADQPHPDQLSGDTSGLLDTQATLGHLPRIVSTDSAAEYWRGDAALTHVLPDGGADVAEHPYTRRYLFASTQHGAGYLGQSRRNVGFNTLCRHDTNILDYRPLLRAVLLNLHAWVTTGTEPPASQYPRLDDRSATLRAEVLDFFATLPSVEIPDSTRLPFVRTVDMGADERDGVATYPAKEGAFYPALVSALDGDGNEAAGIRLPDVVVPVGTHAGWNTRDPSTGAPDQIVPMFGLTSFFPATEAEREASGDPRPSIASRYASREDYEQRVRAAAAALTEARYLLAEDIERAVAAALARFDAATG